MVARVRSSGARYQRPRARLHFAMRRARWHGASMHDSARNTPRVLCVVCHPLNACVTKALVALRLHSARRTGCAAIPTALPVRARLALLRVPLWRWRRHATIAERDRPRPRQVLLACAPRRASALITRNACERSVSAHKAAWLQKLAVLWLWQQRAARAICALFGSRACGFVHAGIRREARRGNAAPSRAQAHARGLATERERPNA